MKKSRVSAIDSIKPGTATVGSKHMLKHNLNFSKTNGAWNNHWAPQSDLLSYHEKSNSSLAFSTSNFLNKKLNPNYGEYEQICPLKEGAPNTITFVQQLRI